MLQSNLSVQVENPIWIFNARFGPNFQRVKLRSVNTEKTRILPNYARNLKSGVSKCFGFYIMEYIEYLI